jgi:hypothetical protein
VKRLICVQPSEYVDQIVDGHEMTKLPYPYYVNTDGTIDRQDFWRGDPIRVVGFVADSARQEVDLWWTEAEKDPNQVIGMYLITSDTEEIWSTHETAISVVKIIDKTPEES